MRNALSGLRWCTCYVTNMLVRRAQTDWHHEYYSNFCIKGTEREKKQQTQLIEDWNRVGYHNSSMSRDLHIQSTHQSGNKCEIKHVISSCMCFYRMRHYLKLVNDSHWTLLTNHLILMEMRAYHYYSITMPITHLHALHCAALPWIIIIESIGSEWIPTNFLSMPIHNM